MKIFFLLVMLLSLGACGLDFDSGPAADLGNTTVFTANEQPKDLSNMSLREAIKTKYQELDFRCDSHWQMVVKQPDGLPEFQYQEKSEVLWDILADFRPGKTLTWFEQYEDFTLQQNFDFELKMRDLAVTEFTELGTIEYEIDNGISLEGQRDFRFLAYDKNGDLAASQSSNRFPSMYVEQIHQMERSMNMNFEDQEMDVQNLSIKLRCYINARVYPEYINDFTKRELN